MPSWPVSLPEYVLEAGYSEQLPKNTIETEMEGGPAKSRRRYTKIFRKFQVALILTQAQALTFETFYLDICASGTVAFDWVHPRTRASMSFRFSQPPPVYVPFGGNYVRVAFTLMEV